MSTTETTIRPVTPAEAKEYCSLLEELVYSTIQLPEAALKNYVEQWTPERVSKVYNQWVFLIAYSGKHPVGLILGTPPEGGVGTIIWVLVDAGTQGKGIGRLLFEKACDEYRKKGSHKVKLTVPDEKTVRFYEKVGMTLEGVHRMHWWKSDFWAMGKIL
jgi:GNAT superfamily N-acetyltransferase